MGLPRQPPASSAQHGGGKGPFGERGFRIGLGLCVVFLAIGALMMALGDGAAGDVGLVFVSTTGLGLVVAGVLLLAERFALRRAAARATAAPPRRKAPEPHSRNGHGNGRVPPSRRKER